MQPLSFVTLTFFVAIEKWGRAGEKRLNGWKSLLLFPAICRNQEICLEKRDWVTQSRMTCKTHSTFLTKRILSRQLKVDRFIKLLFLMPFLTNKSVSRKPGSRRTYVKKMIWRINPWFLGLRYWQENWNLLIAPLLINLTAI